MHGAVVQHIAHRLVHQDISAQVHHSDVSGQFGQIARAARSAGYEPNVGPDESGSPFMIIADGDDEVLIGIENSQLGQAPTPIGLEDRVQFTEQPVCGEVPRLPQGILFTRNTWYHDVRDY